MVEETRQKESGLGGYLSGVTPEERREVLERLLLLLVGAERLEIKKYYAYVTEEGKIPGYSIYLLNPIRAEWLVSLLFDREYRGVTVGILPSEEGFEICIDLEPDYYWEWFEEIAPKKAKKE